MCLGRDVLQSSQSLFFQLYTEVELPALHLTFDFIQFFRQSKCTYLQLPLHSQGSQRNPFSLSSTSSSIKHILHTIGFSSVWIISSWIWIYKRKSGEGKKISKFNESILMGNLQEVDEFVFNLYLFINMLHLWFSIWHVSKLSNLIFYSSEFHNIPNIQLIPFLHI